MIEKQILIVEDEVIVAKNIQNRLEGLGYSVPAIISSGEEAIEKTKEIQPDLVLMDVKLEGKMDGVVAADQIRKQFNIPIIYLTAYGDVQTLDRIKLTEPYGCIIKPFDLNDLQRNIEIALHKNKMEKKLRESEKQLSSFLKSIGDAVIAVDNKENITFLNPIAEKLTGCKKEDVIGYPLVGVFKIFDGMTHISEKDLMKDAIQKNKIVYLENKNFVFINKDREEIPIDDSIAPIKDSQGNITGCIIVFRDISQQKKTQLEQEKHYLHLEELIKEKSSELKITCNQLLQEARSRKKAEETADKIMENLQKIVNGAIEVIISVDMNNKITLWNKRVEQLTGYKSKEVIGKTLDKLSVFANPDEIIDTLMSILIGKKIRFSELILQTKYGGRRIIKVSCTPVRTYEDQNFGALFIGTDITHDSGIHGRLIRGNCYLIPDKDLAYALNLFADLCGIDYNNLLITRSSPEMIKNIPSLTRVKKIILLSQKKLKGFENISTIEKLLNKIKKFSKKNNNSVILLNGIHYFLTKYPFEKFTSALYQIREIVLNTNSILLLRLDPTLLNDKQMAVLENELLLLPNRKIEDLEIGEELYNILNFIFLKKQNNIEISYKIICKEFDIVSKTTSRRLGILKEKGLISIKKRGRLKTIHITQKGRSLLNKRQLL